MKKIFLIEDHDKALKLWRREGIKGLDLVHIDAHMDFGFYKAKPIKKVFNEASSLKELKKGLETSVVFMRYEKDFDKQLNNGNYIYPAMEEGIVKDFYWVVPGGKKEFKKAAAYIKKSLKPLTGQAQPTPKNKQTKIQIQTKDGLIQTSLFGRRFIVCILEKLPFFTKKVLLDIDTDFLVIDSLLNAGNVQNIGKKNPWISPRDLTNKLKKRIKQPEIITVAYSVNGGWTPMEHKHLGDEIAYHFAPEMFRDHLKNRLKAAQYFNLFVSTGRKKYYQQATNLNPKYRAEDNNYGPLYLSLKKSSLAQKEFLRVLKADSKNPACLLGLGRIALEKKDFREARKYFMRVLAAPLSGLFTKVRSQALFELARAEVGLGNHEKAKRVLFCCQASASLQPANYYFLARIFEKQKEFLRAACFYKDAIRLGFSGPEGLLRLLKTSHYLDDNDEVLKYAREKINILKKEYIGFEAARVKNNRRLKGLCKAKGELQTIEKMLEAANKQ